MNNNLYISTGEAARLLGAKQVTVSQLCQRGKINAVKIANRWLIPPAVIDRLRTTYVPKKGRPRHNPR